MAKKIRLDYKVSPFRSGARQDKEGNPKLWHIHVGKGTDVRDTIAVYTDLDKAYHDAVQLNKNPQYFSHKALSEGKTMRSANV